VFVSLAGVDSTLLAGLDGTHPNIRRYRADDAGPLTEVAVYCEAAEGDLPATEGVSIVDSFGTPSRASIMRFDALPTTPSGVVDVAALRNLEHFDADAWTPRSPLEQQLADVWTRVLRVSSVRLDDNFFACGGDSLLAAQLIAGVREGLGVELTLREIFDAATFADLSRTIAEGSSELAAPESEGDRTVDPGELLRRLDDMDDDEVSAWLRQFTGTEPAGQA
jgi:acyl carrier protein